MQLDVTDQEIDWLLFGLRCMEDVILDVLEQTRTGQRISRAGERLFLLDPKPSFGEVHALFERLAGR